LEAIEIALASTLAASGIVLAVKFTKGAEARANRLLPSSDRTAKDTTF
jgi:hypothetical protein